MAATPGRARGRGAAAPGARVARRGRWSWSSTAARAPRPPNSPLARCQAAGGRDHRGHADDDLESLFSKAAARASILGVAGGDGTVRLAAGIAADAGLPLLVVPAGTFNHFAADLGVESADDALAALRDGDSVLVDVATADGAAFLNTASTGVYVDLVKAREQLEPSWASGPPCWSRSPACCAPASRSTCW